MAIPARQHAISELFKKLVSTNAKRQTFIDLVLPEGKVYLTSSVYSLTPCSLKRASCSAVTWLRLSLRIPVTVTINPTAQKARIP